MSRSPTTSGRRAPLRLVAVDGVLVASRRAPRKPKAAPTAYYEPDPWPAGAIAAVADLPTHLKERVRLASSLAVGAPRVRGYGCLAWHDTCRRDHCNANFETWIDLGSGAIHFRCDCCDEGESHYSQLRRLERAVKRRGADLLPPLPEHAT